MIRYTLTIRFFLTLLFVIFASFPFFSQAAIASQATVAAPPAEAKAQPIPSSSVGEGQGEGVVFAKGLLTVRAKDVRLQTLMEAIGKKAGIAVSLSPSLQKEKVTIQFENVPFDVGLRAILQSAGVVNHALVYRQGKEQGKIGEWVIDEIYLKEEGRSKEAPPVTKVQESKPKGKPVGWSALLASDRGHATA